MREMKLPVLLLLCLLVQCVQSAQDAEAYDACLSFGVLAHQHLALIYAELHSFPLRCKQLCLCRRHT